jgi:predicted DCC family thiol-disulfide oxidoreductase YuxK
VIGGLPEDRDIVFYDGTCALCHAAVRLALHRDPDGQRFVFAPLAGRTCEELLGEGAVPELPESVVVRRSDGSLLRESAAVLHLMRRCGGIWSTTARVLEVLPRALLDQAYSTVARTRRRLFGSPADVCPVPPGPLRGRFLP